MDNVMAIKIRTIPISADNNPQCQISTELKKAIYDLG
jgi:hypothetical protein